MIVAYPFNGQNAPLSHAFRSAFVELIIPRLSNYIVSGQSFYQFNLFYLSQRSPFLICGVNFYVCGRFSTPSFYNFWSRSPRIPQQPQSVFEGAHFCRFYRVSFSRVLVHCHPSSPATGAYSFSKSEMGFYVCAV